MKRSELRQMIKEEVIKQQRKPLIESLVPFKKVKDLVYKELLAMYKQLDPDLDYETDLENQFKKVRNVSDLLDIMADRGFDNAEEELLNWIIK